MEDTVENKIMKLMSEMEENGEEFDCDCDCKEGEMEVIMDLIKNSQELLNDFGSNVDKYYTDEMKNLHKLFEYVMDYDPKNNSDKQKFNEMVGKLIKNIEEEHKTSRSVYEKQVKSLTVPENSLLYPVMKKQLDTYCLFAKDGLENDKQMYECVQNVKDIMKQDYEPDEYFKRIIFEFVQEIDKFEKHFKEIGEVNKLHEKSLQEKPELDEKVASVFNGKQMEYTQEMLDSLKKYGDEAIDFEKNVKDTEKIMEKLDISLKNMEEMLDNSRYDKDIEDKMEKLMDKIVEVVENENFDEEMEEILKMSGEIKKIMSERGVEYVVIEEMENTLKEVMNATKNIGDMPEFLEKLPKVDLD
jgi:hypothetical protein